MKIEIKRKEIEKLDNDIYTMMITAFLGLHGYVIVNVKDLPTIYIFIVTSRNQTPYTYHIMAT